MPEHVDTLRDILARLDAASNVEIWMFPPFHLHALKGGCNCQANWRVIFRFEEAQRLMSITSITIRRKTKRCR